jgi:hypothetical protein
MNISIKDIAGPVGGVVALSLKLGLSRGAVSQWTKVPVVHITEVSRLSGFSRELLRPDIFGPPLKPESEQTEAAS